MNIYEKLNKAKLTLQGAGLKKSGRYDFSKYDYFELGDFLPTIIKLEQELGFCCVISFAEYASIKIFDTEKPVEFIEFTSPMSSASLKGMHDVQNLGAVQTYLRRYLYVNAFEIVECDAVDGLPKQEPKQGTKPGQNMEKVPDKMSEAEHSKKVKEIMNLAKSLYGEEKAIQCIKEYLTLGNYAKTDKIPEDKLKDFEKFIDMFDTHLPEGI